MKAFNILNKGIFFGCNESVISLVLMYRALSVAVHSHIYVCQRGVIVISLFLQHESDYSS
jgi:hypothetical protein